MGLLKKCVFRLIDEKYVKVIDMALVRVQKSGHGGRLQLPGLLAGRYGRRLILDDGDEVILVVLFSKSELGVPEDIDLSRLVRRSQYRADRVTIENPEYARNVAKMLFEKREK